VLQKKAILVIVFFEAAVAVPTELKVALLAQHVAASPILLNQDAAVGTRC